MSTATTLESLYAPLNNHALAKKLVRTGGWIVGLGVLPIAAWMCLAPLSMAVVAPAFVKVDLNRRPVQHLEGGIIQKVLVRDGDHVTAGQPVLILGDVGVDADRSRIDFRVMAERASMARLDAEQRLSANIVFPKEVLEAAAADHRVAEAIEKERTLFHTRREALASEAALMREQRGHIQQEIASVRAQVRQSEISLEMMNKDLDANRNLVKDGFISPVKLAQIEANVADYASKLEEHRSELKRAEQHMVDVDLRIKASQNEYTKTASDQLKVTVERLREIEQDQRKSQDAAARQVVAAPTAGEIIDLKFTSPGAVVRPGEPIADIVPHDASLMVEGHIRPEDVSHLHINQAARIKFTAFKYRTTSIVTGKVTYVSGDRLTDRNGQGYYTVMVQADPDALKALGDNKVQAGMPAELYIEGPQQTPLQYLMEPVSSTLMKAAR
jgi:HlyD family secretion protein